MIRRRHLPLVVCLTALAGGCTVKQAHFDASPTVLGVGETAQWEGRCRVMSEGQDSLSDCRDGRWRSSDEAVATVDAGLVRGVAHGDARITLSWQGDTASHPVAVLADLVRHPTDERRHRRLGGAAAVEGQVYWLERVAGNASQGTRDRGLLFTAPAGGGPPGQRGELPGVPVSLHAAAGGRLLAVSEVPYLGGVTHRWDVIEPGGGRSSTAAPGATVAAVATHGGHFYPLLVDPNGEGYVEAPEVGLGATFDGEYGRFPEARDVAVGDTALVVAGDAIHRVVPGASAAELIGTPRPSASWVAVLGDDVLFGTHGEREIRRLPVAGGPVDVYAEASGPLAGWSDDGPALLVVVEGGAIERVEPGATRALTPRLPGVRKILQTSGYVGALQEDVHSAQVLLVPAEPTP